MIVYLIKDRLRKALLRMGMPITQNLKYDYYSVKIIKDVLANGGIGIDVGCHKGEVFDEIIQASPLAKHFGFEPIPIFYQQLVKKYSDKGHKIYPYALTAQSGQAIFKHVKNAPAYSGLQERKYAISNPDIEELTVECRTLDEVIPEHEKISLIKIDVEGAEMGVLLGAKKTIARCKPVILFEFGMGASDMYGTNPAMIFEYFNSLEYNLYSLLDIAQNQILDLPNLKHLYSNAGAYFFVAKPR
jgi:FkbM family methyltransferase